MTTIPSHKTLQAKPNRSSRQFRKRHLKRSRKIKNRLLIHQNQALQKVLHLLHQMQHQLIAPPLNQAKLPEKNQDGRKRKTVQNQLSAKAHSKSKLAVRATSQSCLNRHLTSQTWNPSQSQICQNRSQTLEKHLILSLISEV